MLKLVTAIMAEWCLQGARHGSTEQHPKKTHINTPVPPLTKEQNQFKRRKTDIINGAGIHENAKANRKRRKTEAQSKLHTLARMTQPGLWT